MKTNIFLATLPSYDNRLTLTQKISACEAKRSPLIKVQWTHLQDLHITIGFIPAVEESDFRTIAMGFSTISQTSPFMVNVQDIRVYGNAIVLRIEPYQQLLSMHKKMNQKLMEATNNQYQFQDKGRFDPHLTIGRVRNVPQLNAVHKRQFMELIEEHFKSSSFLIQQAALLRRTLNTTPSYQTLQLYNLRR